MKLKEMKPVDHTETVTDLSDCPFHCRKPQTISKALARMAQNLLSSKRDFEQNNGLFLKYFGEAFACSLVDAERQELDENDVLNALVNTFGNLASMITFHYGANDEHRIELATRVSQALVRTTMGGVRSNLTDKVLQMRIDALLNDGDDCESQYETPGSTGGWCH